MLRGSTVRLSVNARKIVQRDAVYAVYSGVFQLAGVTEAYPGASRQSVGALVKELPRGLEDSETTLALSRACNTICGVKQRQTYTVSEQRKAVYEHISSEHKKSHAVCCREYGVSESALKRLTRILIKNAGRNPFDSKLKQTVDLFPKGAGSHI